LTEVLAGLATDPFEPRIGLHALRGGLEGLHAARLNYAYRIVILLDVSASEITLLDIGAHDEVYR
jgi:mRNA-degrading endonuclease YafQ of YafQ-DinJ toxin-antitoxin module